MIEKLQNIGLTKGEAKVYLALFKLKEGTKYSIAKEANVSASKVYEILDRLANKGLVAFVTKNNVKRYYPSNPQKLKEYTEKKKQELLKEEKIVTELIPQLALAFTQETNRLTVKTYQGYNAIKSALQELEKELNEKFEWLAMGIRSGKEELFNRLWVRFHKKRAEKSKAKLLFTDRDTKYYKDLASIKRTEVKVIKGITPAGVAIYNNITLIAFYKGKDSAYIIIKNKDIANSFTQFFKSLWEIAKK